MNFNLEYYRAFFMTASFLSFTKAAEHLYLTQSAVSQSVKKMENELGCTLFIRTSRGLQLTKEGEILYEHVRRAFGELKTGENLVTQYGEFKKGELKIGATETAIRFLLAPLIEDFKKSFPEIMLSFNGSTTRETCKNLQNGEIRVAILLSPIPPEFHFEMTKIREIQDILVVSSDFPIDLKKCYTPGELVTFPLISLTSENSVRTYLDNWFLENDIIFMPEYSVRSTGLVIPLVLNHLGVGIVPYDFAAKELEKGTLLQVPTTSAPPPRTIYLATNPAYSISAIEQKFIQFILTSVREL